MVLEKNEGETASVWGRLKARPQPRETKIYLAGCRHTPEVGIFLRQGLSLNLEIANYPRGWSPRSPRGPSGCHSTPQVQPGLPADTGFPDLEILSRCACSRCQLSYRWASPALRVSFSSVAFLFQQCFLQIFRLIGSDGPQVPLYKLVSSFVSFCMNDPGYKKGISLKCHGT